MYNSRTNPTHPVFDQHLFNQHCRREKPQNPATRLRCRHELFIDQCLWQEAFASLHYTPGLHFVSPPFVPFRSLSAPASATHARVLLSFHYAHANPPFHSAPLWLPYPQARTQSQNGKLHSTPLNSLHFIQSSPLLSPTQLAVCPAVEFAPEDKSLKYPATQLRCR
jgi:hypothetical protein